MKRSLPTDSAERKTYPLFSGLFGYFGAALTGVAHHSWKSNEKHNPGQPLHWSIDKSTDHADCIARHLLDLGDLLGMDAQHTLTPIGRDALLAEADALAWRALALSQTLRMKFYGAPLPFNARRSVDSESVTLAKICDEKILRDANILAGYPAPRCIHCQRAPCVCVRHY